MVPQVVPASVRLGGVVGDCTSEVQEGFLSQVVFKGFRGVAAAGSPRDQVGEGRRARSRQQEVRRNLKFDSVLGIGRVSAAS